LQGHIDRWLRWGTVDVLFTQVSILTYRLANLRCAL
jgi:hypothetical protein